VNDFVCSLVRDPDTSFSYEVRARWLGEMLIVPPETRVLQEEKTRERETQAWEAGIKALPVLVIQGKEDKLVQSVQMKEAFEGFLGPEGVTENGAHVRDAEGKVEGRWWEWHWIENAGHTPAWEKWEEHDEIVLNFMKRLGA
jgi:pimeloyl-ACP methyl ester carboxylesterase